eukprot:TRINITY_DN32502_c0_g1_i1.p1 TRINITY_DN32502_c0_g1~~TRINITY_DN32502_c0_g1_i1.p1  ORF type:complete len:493 (-),score=72.43 TRINITY_DN32502_c0_g1_i1:144-1622(-)
MEDDPRRLNYMNLKRWLLTHGALKPEVDVCSGKDTLLLLAENKGLLPAPGLVNQKVKSHAIEALRESSMRESSKRSAHLRASFQDHARSPSAFHSTHAVGGPQESAERENSTQCSAPTDSSSVGTASPNSVSSDPNTKYTDISQIIHDADSAEGRMSEQTIARYLAQGGYDTNENEGADPVSLRLVFKQQVARRAREFRQFGMSLDVPISSAEDIKEAIAAMDEDMITELLFKYADHVHNNKPLKLTRSILDRMNHHARRAYLSVVWNSVERARLADLVTGLQLAIDEVDDWDADTIERRWEQWQGIWMRLKGINKISGKLCDSDNPKRIKEVLRDTVVQLQKRLPQAVLSPTKPAPPEGEERPQRVSSDKIELMSLRVSNELVHEFTGPGKLGFVATARKRLEGLLIGARVIGLADTSLPEGLIGMSIQEINGINLRSIEFETITAFVVSIPRPVTMEFFADRLTDRFREAACDDACKATHTAELCTTTEL